MVVSFINAVKRVYEKAKGKLIGFIKYATDPVLSFEAELEFSFAISNLFSRWAGFSVGSDLDLGHEIGYSTYVVWFSFLGFSVSLFLNW